MPPIYDQPANDPAEVEIVSPDPIALNKTLPPSLSAYPDWPTFWAWAQTQPTNVLRDLWNANSINQEAPAVGGGYQPFTANPLSQNIPDRWVATAYMALKESRMLTAQGTRQTVTQEGTNTPLTVVTMMTPNSPDQQGNRENQGVIPGVTPNSGGVAPQVTPS